VSHVPHKSDVLLFSNNAYSLAAPMLALLLASLFSTISVAAVVCNPHVPRTLIPELASCDYALRRLEFQQQQCGSRNIIFSPSAQGAFVYNLPSIFVGAGPNYIPTADTWCAIVILWQPRPTARLPPADEDAFPFTRILRAAHGIRDQCLVGRPGSLPQIGREWIKPRELVDVQIAGVFRQDIVDNTQKDRHDAALAGKNVTLKLADGTSLDVALDMLKGDMGCGNLITGLERSNSSALD